MPKISIIDDDPDIIDALTMVLQSKGYCVVSAGNVDDGFALIEKENPDLIVLDVMMLEPDDGFYMAVKLRKNLVMTPIIMLTSVSRAVGMKFAVGDSVPVDEFLEKPVSPAVLLDKIENQLKKGGN